MRPCRAGETLLRFESGLELDSVRFAAKFPSAAWSLEIGAGPLQPNDQGRGPGTMHHLSIRRPPMLLRSFASANSSDPTESVVPSGSRSGAPPTTTYQSTTTRSPVGMLGSVTSRKSATLSKTSVRGTAPPSTVAGLSPASRVPFIRTSGSFRRLGFTFLTAEDFHTFLVTMVPLE